MKKWSFFPCKFTSHHRKTLLQSCKMVPHHCIGRCTAAKRPRTTAKRIYSIAKRPRTIAKRFCSIVSYPCSGAGRDCTAIPPPRWVARVPRRPARCRVCGAGRASRSGGSIRGLPASASRGRPVHVQQLPLLRSIRPCRAFSELTLFRSPRNGQWREAADVGASRRRATQPTGAASLHR